MIQEEFDIMPAIGPSVHAFLDLLAGIAAREFGVNKTEKGEDTDENENDERKSQL